MCGRVVRIVSVPVLDVHAAAADEPGLDGKARLGADAAQLQQAFARTARYDAGVMVAGDQRDAVTGLEVVTQRRHQLRIASQRRLGRLARIAARTIHR